MTTPVTESAPTILPVSVAPKVEIACIFFDGETPRTEADEYVEIINSGATVADLAGWTLLDSADGRPTFEFPSLTLAPGETIRVYTNEIHSNSGGLSFGSGVAIWSNSEPDQASLLNTNGETVSTASYPPGCNSP